MNNRIKELAEHAGGEFYTGFAGSPNSVKFMEEDFQKFAELIVRECINEIHVADVGNLQGKGYYLDKVAEHIEKYFGVK